MNDVKLKRFVVGKEIVDSLTDRKLMGLLINSGISPYLPIERLYDQNDPIVYYFNSPDESLEGWEWEDVKVETIPIPAGQYVSGQEIILKPAIEE